MLYMVFSICHISHNLRKAHILRWSVTHSSTMWCPGRGTFRALEFSVVNIALQICKFTVVNLTHLRHFFLFFLLIEGRFFFSPTKLITLFLYILEVICKNSRSSKVHVFIPEF